MGMARKLKETALLHYYYNVPLTSSLEVSEQVKASPHLYIYNKQVTIVSTLQIRLSNYLDTGQLTKRQNSNTKEGKTSRTYICIYLFI